jgi:chloride channel protein, CIC family
VVTNVRSDGETKDARDPMSSGTFEQLDSASPGVANVVWGTPARRSSRLWRRLGLVLGRQLATVVRDDHAFLIVMAAFVGVASGAAAGALLAWIETAIDLFPQPDEGPAWVRWLVLVLVPVAGGLIAGLLHLVARRVIREPVVGGIAGVVEAVARRDGAIPGRQAAIVGLGTGVTIGSGGSCGYEGPSVAIGAAVGSVLGRFFGLGRRRRLAMVGAGCAGGLAAAFDAPLAGVIFTIEIVFRGSAGASIGTMSMLLPLVVAAVAGTFTSHAIRGEHPAFAHTSYASASVVQLLFYVVMGVLAGIVGTLMGRAILSSARWFAARPWASWINPALGALGVGLVAAVVSNEILGAGHATVARALRGELLWSLALLLCLLKIGTTALTLGSGGFGGVLMPSLYVGATLGTVVGALSDALLGSSPQGPGAFAVVGMGAIFAATMHAPLTPIVVIFELTRDYAIMMPLMLSCILAGFVARRFKAQSLTQLELAHQGVVLPVDPDRDVMQRVRVGDIMRPPAGVLAESSTLDEVRRAVVDSELRGTFVVDEAGSIAGFIDGDQLTRRLLSSAMATESSARDIMSTRNIALLLPSDTVAGAMLASARTDMELMPVVDDARHLIGVVHRSDLLRLYSDQVLDKQATLDVHVGSRRPDEELHLGKGIAVERVVVGRGWAGRTLAELQLRNRTGCMALEWCRGDVVLPIDPRAPLREGDIVALAGTREQLLAARDLS